MFTHYSETTKLNEKTPVRPAVIRTEHGITDEGVKMFASSYAISIDEDLFSPATVDFVRAYNTNSMKADKLEVQNNSLFQVIGKGSVAKQLTILLSTAVFKNPQVKQTFKISCQRYFANTFNGMVLVIKGNNASIRSLTASETLDIKGRAIDLSVKEKAAQEAADKAAKKAALLESAEKTTIQLESEKVAREAAEKSAAAAVKAANKADKVIKEVEKKSQSAIDILTAQNEELKKQLDRAIFENTATTAAYKELVEAVRTAKTLKALKTKVA
jgi:hypothetical protein